MTTSDRPRRSRRFPGDALAALALLVTLLLACRRSDIKGSLVLDGAEFEVEECRVGQLTLGGQKQDGPPHRMLLLDDGDGRELHFSDAQRSKVSAYYVPARGKAPVHIGTGCSTLSLEGDPAQSPTSVKGTLEVSCAGGGHTLNGKVDYSRCKAWNMLKPGGR